MTFTEKLEKKAAKLVAAPEFQDMMHYVELKQLLESLAEARKDGGLARPADPEEPPVDWETRFEDTMLEDVARIKGITETIQGRCQEFRAGDRAAEAEVIEGELQQYVSLQHAGFLRLLSKYGKETTTQRFQEFMPRVFTLLGYPVPGETPGSPIGMTESGELAKNRSATVAFIDQAFARAAAQMDGDDDFHRRQEMKESREMILTLFDEVSRRKLVVTDEEDNELAEEKAKGVAGRAAALFTPPLAQALKTYSRDDFQRDIIAGFVIAVAGIPKAMSYAKLADLPVGLGIATSYAPCIVYALLGASRQGAISPQSVTCLLLGQMIDEVLVGTEFNTKAQRISLAMLFTFATGLVIMAIGALRLGFLLNFISRSVLSGFVSASAIIACLSTVKSLLGLHVEKSPIVYEMVVLIAAQLPHIHWPTAAIGLTGVVYLFLVPLLQKRGVRRLKGSAGRLSSLTRILLKIPTVLHIMVFGLIIGGMLCSWTTFVAWKPRHVIVGRGATAPALYLEQVMERYDCKAYGEQVSSEYESVGSGGGLRSLNSNRTLAVDYVASEVVPSEEELEASKWHAFPFLATAICPVVHVPFLPASAPIDLILDMVLLTDIFDGRVTHWDDSRIRAMNPNLPWHSVPERVPIHVVTRDAASGTTAAFERALRTCDGCNASWAAGMQVAWGAEVKGAGSNRGVVSAVAAQPWSIGYATASETLKSSTGTVRCSALRAGDSTLTHEAAAWPLAVTSYIMAPRTDHPAQVLTGSPRQEKCSARARLFDFMSFIYSRRALAGRFHYKAMPEPETLHEILCDEDRGAARRLSASPADDDSEDFKCKVPSASCSDIEVVGSINSELPSPTAPRRSAGVTWGAVIRNGLMLAGVALLEHVANVKLYADRNDYSISVAGDLVAVGLANCAGACFGSFVVACGFSRSALNERARSQLSLLLSSVVTFAVVYSVAPLLTMLPAAILNVILFCAVAPLVDVKAVRSLLVLRRRGLMDLIALIFAFVCTCFFGVVTGMMLAVGFSILDFIRKSVSPQVSTLERTPGTLHYEPSFKSKSWSALPRRNSGLGAVTSGTPRSSTPRSAQAAVKVLRFEAPLWFANATTFLESVLSQTRDRGLRGLVIDMSMVPWVDHTAANAVKKLSDRMTEQGLDLVFAQTNVDVKATLKLVCGLGEESFCNSIYAAEAVVTRGPNKPATATAAWGAPCADGKAVDLH